MPSSLERAFLFHWRVLAQDLPEPAAEYRAIPGRRSRLDFAFPDAWLGIELHGGTFKQGRHTRGTGFQSDRQKMNKLVELGWVTLEYTTQDINDRPHETIGQIRRVLADRSQKQTEREFQNAPDGHKKPPLRDFPPPVRENHAPKTENLCIRQIHIPPFACLHPPKLCRTPRRIPCWNNFQAHRETRSATARVLAKWQARDVESIRSGQAVSDSSVRLQAARSPG